MNTQTFYICEQSWSYEDSDIMMITSSIEEMAEWFTKFLQRSVEGEYTHLKWIDQFYIYAAEVDPTKGDTLRRGKYAQLMHKVDQVKKKKNIVTLIIVDPYSYEHSYVHLEFFSKEFQKLVKIPREIKAKRFNDEYILKDQAPLPWENYDELRPTNKEKRRKEASRKSN